MAKNNVRKDFPIFQDRDIAYLDSGATTQKPIQVINEVDNFYKKIMQILIEGHIV